MANAETWTDKFTRKFKENPLVPLGAAATVGTLIIASKKMRRGESQQMNHWLRARVAAQGFTILAICGGTYWMNKQKREVALAEADAEKLRLDQERREFEQRLREAEMSHRTMSESRGSGAGKADGSTPTLPSSNGTQQSWSEWLRWKRSTSASDAEKENPS